MPSKKKTFFQRIWLDTYGWLQEDPASKHDAWCKWCNKSFNLSNMGERALISHAQSNKHSNFAANKKSGGIGRFFHRKIPVGTALSKTSSNNVDGRILKTLNYKKFSSFSKYRLIFRTSWKIHWFTSICSKQRGYNSFRNHVGSSNRVVPSIYK